MLKQRVEKRILCLFVMSKILCLWSDTPGFNCFALVFSCMYCRVLIYALIPFCMYWEMIHWSVRALTCEPNVYVSWYTSEIRVRLVTSNINSPPLLLLLAVSRLCFLCGSFYFFVFRVFAILSRLFLAVVWSPSWKGLTSWLSCLWCLLVFL